ncbi:MAG TPA: Hsp20/alpha crystallin family protein [Ktedonobacterales bacterium]|nr:Hsp20/alpha crystallin family protein [Ktedonobacterales bacterium]
MSSVMRWDPFSDLTPLHDVMNQIVNQAVLRPGWLTGGQWAGGAGGLMNVLELDNTYYCYTLLPGVSPDAVDLSVRQNTLTLKATVSEPFTEEQRKNGAYLLKEFGAREFSRSISFPKDVDADHVEARFSNGVLALVIPIAQHAQPKRIAISTETPTEPQRVIAEAKEVAGEATAVTGRP